MKNKAIVLGAGPIGLVTAWQLLKNNWDVEIYEKNSIVGGMCRTWEWDGYLVDTGPHIYHTPDNNLAKFWEKHFGDLMIKGDFWCKNVQGKNFDEYWDYPLSWESIANYPSDLKKQVLKELDNLDFEQKARARNYSEYIEGQVGPTMRKMFFKTYPEKVWGISTDDMAPDWAPKRIEFRKKITPFYHNQWNAVGKYGTGCIYERIKKEIVDLGGGVYFNHQVDLINSTENAITNIKFSNDKNINVEKNTKIVSSLPITLTAKLLGFESKLNFRGIRSVYLSYNTPEILKKGVHWLYYGSEKIFFNRITESKKLSPFVAPKDRSFLTAEITYSKNDQIDKMESKKLIKEIANQVEKVGLISKDKLLNGSDNKEPFVYPLLHTGYQEELAKTRASINKFQQLYSIGTGGDYNYADSQILFHKAFDTVAIMCGKDSTYTQTIRKNPPTKLNKIVNINGTNIGKGMPKYIIAEAGMNHNGSLNLAKQLVDEAKKANCNAVKFQSFSLDSRISSKVKSVNYAETITGLEESLDEMFNRLSMPFDKQKILFEYAKKVGIEIFSTPFDFESVDFLEELGVNVYKIASMDIVNLPLIKYVAETGKPIVMSTGMSNLGQIEEAVESVQSTGNKNLALLHCNSSYPADPNEMNLKVISTLQRAFNIPVGLSDHTFGIFVSQMALAIGADLIERHFTLDRSFEGPDHILSSEPIEMAKLVSTANDISLIMGDGIKKIQPNEYDTINSQRKSLYAACNIKKGELISTQMISIKGPGGGLLPKYFDIVVGREAKIDIDKDFPITWELI